jgi:hypothetical protein
LGRADNAAAAARRQCFRSARRAVSSACRSPKKSDNYRRFGNSADAGHGAHAGAAMTPEEQGELRAQLARLQQEHRDLDAAIAALQDSPGADILQVQRLKKRKLYLRDRISFIEDQLTPDIIA